MRRRLPSPVRARPALTAIVLLGVSVRVAAVIALRHHGLAGDELEYDSDGRLFAAGHPFWSLTPYGLPHPSAWKAPGYVLWVGVLETVLGVHHTRVELVQAVLCGTATILLTWRLGARLFGARIGLLAAGLVALDPLAWQYEVLLLSESLATPLTLAVLLLMLERPATVRRAAGVGGLVGLLMLVRPTSVCLLAGVAVAWWLATRPRAAAAARTVALTAATAAVVIVPWTVRNAAVIGGFEPISGQDAALAGTFNPVAAHDPVWPYAWRAVTPQDASLFDPRHPLPERDVRTRLIALGRQYISAHPESLPEAFFWNGITRLWDLRRPARVTAEITPEGRLRGPAVAGLGLYYLLLPLALLALWRLRRSRPAVVWPLLATALAASVVFTVDAGTRYRAPFEPVIALLAVAGAGELPVLRARR